MGERERESHREVSDPDGAEAGPSVLLVEDNPVDARRVQVMLEGWAAVSLAGSLSEGARHLLEARPELVLLDLSLPDSEGLETLGRLREQMADLPVVILTGADDERTALEALRAGAQDYLVKGRFDAGVLRRSLRYAAERHRLLRELSLHDELTGLLNRRGFLTVAGQQLNLHRARGTGEGLLIVYADLDGLKRINDRHGHDAGDQAIRAAADVLRHSFRSTDIVARIGGDEFAALLVGVRDETLRTVLDRVGESVAAFNGRGGQSFRLSISAGAARVDASLDAGLEEMLSEADRAMYRHKRGGR